MTKATDAMRAANIKHGYCRTGEYEAWVGAKRRCYNKKCKAYPKYGGRGITMDPRWKDDFIAFFADMGPRPSPKHSLDRYPDNDGPYAPENCRWATVSQQNRNRSTCLNVEYQGRQMSLVDACELANVPYNRVQARLKYLGWTFERAISERNLREPKTKAPIKSRGFAETRWLWPTGKGDV